MDACSELFEAGLIDETTHGRVLTHLEASNILDCERVIDLLDVESSTQYILNLGLYEDFAQIPGGNQFRLAVPEDATALELEFSNFASSSEQLGISVFIREGLPVGHEVTTAAAIGLAMAVPTDFDHQIDLAQFDASVRLEQGGDLELIPGNTYYVSIASLNLGGIELLDFTTGRVDISAKLLSGEAEPTPTERGCRCQNTRFSAPDAPGLLGLLFLLTFVRNRRFTSINPF